MKPLTSRRDSLRSAALAVLVAALPQRVDAGPGFTDATVAAGLTYIQHIAREAPNCIFRLGSFCEPERMSGGAAVGDVDGDGDLDLYVTRLYQRDILFDNRGNGTFRDITVSAGLGAYDLQSNGAAFADIDNDGDLDLYVTVLGNRGDPINNRNYLFINNGHGGFSEEAIPRGAAVLSGEARKIYSVAFGDYDRDGWLDIHVNEWLPGLPSHSRLLRNLGLASPGFFEDVTVAAGVSLESSDAFSSAFADLDDDGWPDLAVAADFGTSRLFWNNGDGTFSDGTAASGVGSDENGMGSTIGDFDGDGDLDWFVTSIYDATCPPAGCNWGDTGNRLYRNEGGRLFGDATGAAHVRDGAWGWGASYLDYDNDGDLDLVMTNGVDFPGTSIDDAFNTDPMRMWRNDGTGSMVEVAAAVGLTDTGSGKGLLIFDYDNDGDLDIFIVNNASTPRLYRNDGGNANAWLRVEMVGTASNRDGLGARVTVQLVPGGPMQVREIGTSSHFLGQSERIAHFGLGAGSAPVALVRVKWPSDQIQDFTQVPRNSTLVAVEPNCDRSNPLVWATPGEVHDVIFSSDGATLSWSPPVPLGGTSVMYDTIRSGDPVDFGPSAACVESDDGSDLSAADAAAPLPDRAFYYLVRAENACPAGEGQGSLGTDSGGVARAGRDCT